MGRIRRDRDVRGWRAIAPAIWGPAGDPTVYGTIEVDAVGLRAYVAELRARTGVHVTLTHVVARAAAMVLAENPDVNAIVRLGAVHRRPTIDVALVVAADGGADLTTTKVDRADTKDVIAIAREIVGSVESARRRTNEAAALERRRRGWRLPSLLLRPVVKMVERVTGGLDVDLSRWGLLYDPYGSVLVTNLGAFGIEQGFAALVPLARTAIVVALGSVHDRAVARGGQAVVRPTLLIGGTFDHRVVDAYHIGRLARRTREILEDPARWMGMPAGEISEAPPAPPAALDPAPR